MASGRLRDGDGEDGGGAVGEGSQVGEGGGRILRRPGPALAGGAGQGLDQFAEVSFGLNSLIQGGGRFIWGDTQLDTHFQANSQNGIFYVPPEEA